MFDVADNKLQS